MSKKPTQKSPHKSPHRVTSRVTVDQIADELEKLRLLERKGGDWEEGELRLGRGPLKWIHDEEEELWEGIDDAIDRDMTRKK